MKYFQTVKSSYSRIVKIEGYQWVMAFAILAAFIHFVIVLFVVFSRINYRYELEWMEGASLVQTYRIFTGQNLYIQPSLEYIPMIYPPLYFYLAALLVKITGISFLPLRIISFASTLGCLVIIYFVVKEKTRSMWLGLVSAGSFVATFKLGGAWFDIARVDMLFIFLSLAALFFLGKNTTKNSILAGTLFALSFLAKQTALPIFLVAAAATFLLFRKQVLPFIGTFAILAAIPYFYQNTITNGWYQYYILTLPASHQIKWMTILSALQTGFGIELIAILVGFSPLLFGLRHVFKDKLLLYYYFAVMGIICVSVLARINRGAYINTLVPAYSGLSIIVGLGMGWWTEHYKIKKLNKGLFQSLLWLAITIQFVLLGYNPIPQIPTLADRRAGDALVAEIQSVPGDILIPYHNYLALFAGKKVNFHMITFNEIRGSYSKKQPEMRNVLKQFNSTPFSLFIMDIPDNLIQISHCAVTQNIQYETATTFYPVTGFSVRPSILSSGCP
jgi:4-amino-4-deoxy-L-arabinose transferase-like glycosyltransferase